MSVLGGVGPSGLAARKIEDVVHIERAGVMFCDRMRESHDDVIRRECPDAKQSVKTSRKVRR